MNDSRQALGRWGENVAAEYLARRGYVLVERNVRTDYGEIDLVTRQRDVVVFVEVKTRTTTAFGYPEESITARKKEHMIAAAQAYMQTHSEPRTNWRIDVIAIEAQSKRDPQITHFENAV